MNIDAIEKGLAVWAQVHQGQAKIAGTIIDYAFSAEGNYLQCMVELELPNPMLPGQVIRQIYPKPIQSYKLTRRKSGTPATQVITETPVSAETGKPHTIFTIGYGIEAIERHAASSQIGSLLKRSTPTILIDIRITPYSGKIEGWNREDLETRYTTRYMHVRELGNENHHTGQDIHLVDEESGLDQLEHWLEQFDICLLCGCYRAASCHRGYVAEKLAARTGSPICHILQPLNSQPGAQAKTGQAQPATTAKRKRRGASDEGQAHMLTLWESSG